MEDSFPFIQLDFTPLSPEEMAAKSQNFYQMMDKRRTVRDFSDQPVPREVIEQLILTGSSAPSGAHKQPWNIAWFQTLL